MPTQATTLDRALAAIGTLLVALPLAFPACISVVFFVRTGTLRIDPLMPAEMVPGYLAGAAMLLVPSMGLKVQRRELLGSVVVALTSLGGAQALAVVLGLASGARPASGWRLVAVVALLAAYIAAVVATGIVGGRIARRAFQRA